MELKLNDVFFGCDYQQVRRKSQKKLQKTLDNPGKCCNFAGCLMINN